MVSLLEELLSFHSWYKYGEAPFGPDYENGDADDLLLLLHQMMARTIAYCLREDGNGWKLRLCSFVMPRTLMPAVARGF
jgi:hypothetical protein